MKGNKLPRMEQLHHENKNRLQSLKHTQTFYTGVPPTNLTITFSTITKTTTATRQLHLNARNRSVPLLQNFSKTQQVPQGRRAYRCSAEEHGAPDLLIQSRQLLSGGAATEVWSPWLEEISSNFVN